jgi:hypothetical protein
MRRAGTTGCTRPCPRCPGAFIGALVDSAEMVGTDAAPSAGGAEASEADGGSSAAAGAAASGDLAIAGFSSRAAGAAGGFTVPAGGGATTITGRVAVTAPKGGLATTAPDGGRLAIAGEVVGGVTIGAACRGCGTILRGSGRAGTAVAGGAAATGVDGCAGGAAGFAGTRTGRAPSSSSCFLARMAFITSPGLEMFDRSILGTTACAPWRVDAPPACDVDRDSCVKCARTFSASSPSIELECVLPAGTPSSGRMSRIARDFTSSSFARSLIRTLLIRLFSILCRQTALSCSLLPHGTGRSSTLR